MQLNGVDLTGQVALITGASRGIGRAVAIELAARGAHIALNYASNEAAAQETAAAVAAYGVDYGLYKADVADYKSVQAMVKEIVARFGKVDILVNNAGILTKSFLMLMDGEEFQKVLNTNVSGAFHCIKAVGPHMIRRRSGAVVNMSSLAGTRGTVGQGAYASSKAAVESLTRIASKEFAGYGIRVNALAPGYIDTGMMDAVDNASRDEYLKQIPMKRLGRAQEVASCVSFLVSPMAAYVTGQTIIADGGLSQN